MLSFNDNIYINNKKFRHDEIVLRNILKVDLIQDSEKAQLLKKAKKLAKNCNNGNRTYYDWIMNKFGNFRKNTEKIIFFYDDKHVKKYAGAIVLKNKRKFLLNKPVKIAAPRALTAATNEPIPTLWTISDDFLYVVDRAGVENKEIVKVIFCASNVELAKVFIINNVFAKNCIVNSYKTEKNYICLKSLGFPELHFTFAAKNSVLLRLEGVCIEMPVECEYIYLGKNSSKIISNLVMFPAIENFYMENEIFLTESNKKILNQLSVSFSCATAKTGFWFASPTNTSVSPSYVIQIYNQKTKISFPENESSPLFSVDTKTL